MPETQPDALPHLAGRPKTPAWSRRALPPPARRLLVTALLVLLPCAALARAWPLGGVSAVGDDLIYYLPVRQYIGERVRAGELPLWNPYVSMGTPLAADPQSGLWYPFTYLFVFLPPLPAYAVSTVVHFAIAGAGMYRFLRARRHEWRAALLGAVAFEFCGYMVAHREHLTIHHAVAWMPWIFYFWERFAATGAYRHFALAGGCFGLQLLVQHMQPSIITAVLLTGYVAFVLRPVRPSLCWQYPLGMAVAAAVAAVQILPTWYHFAGSGRSTPAYYLFVENSWAPPSALLLLFPMVFGNPTPGFLWTDKWYGISHLVEQWCYPSIAILMLAVTSSALLRRGAQPDSPRFTRRGWNREILFWWVACGVALLIALGSLSPLSWLLFHLPVYRSLRVPARWILVWSFALPVMASCVVSTLLRGSAESREIARRLHWLGTRALPATAVACLGLLVLSRWWADYLRETLPYWVGQPDWSGLKAAVRLTNAAIWWPLLIMAITVFTLLQWLRRAAGPGGAGRFALLLTVCTFDLISVAAFVGVDNRTYRSADLTGTMPLTAAIDNLGPRPGERLLVPRTTSSYYHPLEVLWPLSNLTQGIPTLNGYGPLWAPVQRQLFRFMAWGSSEEMLALLRNPNLLRAAGVRFLAARSEEERDLLAWAAAPAVVSPELGPVPGTEQLEPVPWWSGLLWPVRVDTPGIYQLELDADPIVGSSARWFVRLESGPYHELAPTHVIEPVDLALGPRRMRFLFACTEAPGAAHVRIKSEIGQALRAGQAVFGKVADAPVAAAGWDAGATRPIQHRAKIEDGIDLYELSGAYELVWLAERVEIAADLPGVIDRLRHWEAAPLPRTAVLERRTGIPAGPRSTAAKISSTRPVGHRLVVNVISETQQLLAFNESYDQGWQATLDGSPTSILRVNAAVQGVLVPPGDHKVEWVYRPVGLPAGAVISAGAVTLLLITAFAFRHRISLAA